MKLKLLFASLFYLQVVVAQIAAPPVPETWENDIWFSNQWMHFSTVDYSFDSNCLPVLAVLQVLDFGSGSFVNSSRLTTTYNGNNQIIETINELWNNDTQTWEIDRRSTQSYSQNNLIEILNYLWIDNAWQLDYGVFNTFTSNLLTESVIQNWDENTNTWISDTKQEFTYNAIPLIATTLASSWDATNNVWIQDKRTSFVYDSNDLNTSKTIEDWENNTWINNSLETNSFDANAFLMETLISEWNTTTSQYEFAKRELYTNNAQGNYTTRIDQNYLLGNWVNATRDRRTYPDCYILSIENPLAEEFSVYPIPTDANINVKINATPAEALILDINGKILQRKTLIHRLSAIDLSKLHAGVYFISVSIGNQVLTKKILKKD